MKGELLGTNYRCGDWATFTLQLQVAASPTMTPAPYTARVTLDFTTDATGQSGVGLQPSTDPTHLRVNSGVIADGAGTGAGGSDGGFVPAGSGLTTTAATNNGTATITQNGTFFTSNSYARLVFDVTGLDAGTTTIVRSDAQIKCKPYSTPTGNMQVSLNSMSIVSPGNEAVSAGAQTVNFRGVGNLAGLGVPVLEVIKTVADVTGVPSPTCPATPTSTTSITSSVTPTEALYCFYVSNYGTADATNVTLNDVDTSSHPIALAGLSGTSLLAGATATGSYGPITYTTGGVYNDTATVTSDAGTVSASADATVRIESGVVLTKTVVEAGELCPGSTSLHLVASATSQSVTYCYGVTNYSAYYVDISSLIDDRAGIGAPVSLNLFADTNYSDGTTGTGITALAAYATATSSYSQTFAAGDQTGIKTNVATLTYIDESTKEVDSTASVEFQTAEPQLTVDKVQSGGGTPSAVGDVITYTITATNTGAVVLTSVSIADANATMGACSPSIPVATLALDASISCTATHTVTQADLDAGEVANTAIGTGTPVGELPINWPSPEVIVPVTQSPALSVTKVRTSGPTAAFGQTVAYLITATNSGNVTLSSVSIADANATIGTCTPSIPVASLAVGAWVTCEASHVVTADDVRDGTISNVATAAGTPPGGGTTEGESPEVVTPLVIAPELTVTIEPIEPVPPTLPPGSTIRYRVQVRNTGNVPLSGVTPRPNNFVIESCDPPVGSTLLPGQTMECIGSHVVTPAESTGKRVDVSVTATGQAPDGQEVVDEDPAVSVLRPTLPMTGTEAMPLVALGLVTLGTGGGLTLVARRRRRP